MNKGNWVGCLKEMERLLLIAQGNVVAAQNQVDELTHNVASYKDKIKGMK